MSKSEKGTPLRGRKSMKAAIWYGRRDVRVEDVPEPLAPPPGQVKIEVSWCGICGTDLHEYLGGPLKIPADAPHPMRYSQLPNTKPVWTG